jgi:hypothetical protein
MIVFWLLSQVKAQHYLYNMSINVYVCAVSELDIGLYVMLFCLLKVKLLNYPTKTTHYLIRSTYLIFPKRLPTCTYMYLTELNNEYNTYIRTCSTNSAQWQLQQRTWGAFQADYPKYVEVETPDLEWSLVHTTVSPTWGGLPLRTGTRILSSSCNKN